MPFPPLDPSMHPKSGSGISQSNECIGDEAWSNVNFFFFVASQSMSTKLHRCVANKMLTRVLQVETTPKISVSEEKNKRCELAIFVSSIAIHCERGFREWHQQSTYTRNKHSEVLPPQHKHSKILPHGTSAGKCFPKARTLGKVPNIGVSIANCLCMSPAKCNS